MTTLSLAWTGEVDIATIRPLLAQADVVIGTPALTQLVLDLSEVTFLDSIGIGTLLDMQMRLHDRHATLCMQAVPTCVVRVLEVAGVRELLDITP